MFSGMDDSPHQETPPPPVDSPNSRQWITILHISALAGFLLVGFGQILAPLIVWLMKKNEVPGLDAAGPLPLAEEPRFPEANLHFLEHLKAHGQQLAALAMAKAMGPANGDDS